MEWRRHAPTAIYIDRSTKTLAAKIQDETEKIYNLTDSIARDAGRDISEAAEKSAKVTIYYTEEAGNNVTHSPLSDRHVRALNAIKWREQQSRIRKQKGI